MAYRLIGQDFTVGDLEAKVTGRAKYAEDFRMDGMVFAKMLTSPVPHAKIKKIDVAAALKMPGVVGILTDNDITITGYPFPPPQQPILARDEVYFVGDPILAVAAETELQAAEAIEAINIEFEILPHVTDPLESLFPGGPNARSNGNVAGGQINLQTLKWEVADFVAAGDDKLPMGKPGDTWKVGDVDAGLKAAKLVIDETWVSQTYAHHSLEPRSTFAYWQGNKVVLHGSTQSQTAAVPNISRILGVAPDDLIYVAEYCGGGFGSKISGFNTMAIPAVLSKKLNRPVMLRFTRENEYSLGSARPGFQARIKLGFDEKGRILAADAYIVQENGPYLGAGDFRAAGNALSLVYQPVAMRWQGLPVLTNTPPPGAQRGPGENQFTMAIEPFLDKAAAKLGIDRLEIRKINAPTNASKMGADQGPVTSAFQREALDKGAQMFDWAAKSKLSKTKVGNKVVGVGIGQGYHSAGSNGFDGLLRITPDGKLHIHTGVGNLGTASHYGTARVAADLMNYKWENTVLERGDTRKGTPWNSSQAGSLTASTQARTMYVAALDAKAKLLDIAAQMLGGKPEDYDLGEEKVVHKTDATKSITMAQAAQKAIDLGGKYSGKDVPSDINAITKSAVGFIAGTGLVAVAKDALPRVGVTPGLVASFARVEVDTETGKIEVKELVAVADCGTVLHPMGLANTMKGGAVQGMDMVMYGRHVYDPKLGIPAAASIEASKLPTFLDVPVMNDMRTGAAENPDPQNPIGIKGVGEPAVGAPGAAIASAVADALGVTFNHYPLSLDQVLNHLNGRPQAHKPLQVNTV